MTKIAVSKLGPNYELWLKKLGPELELVNFDARDPGDFTSQVQLYSGLVLTGGGDLHPSLYGSPDTGNYCQGIDIKRDDLEFKLLDAALTCGIPILAICRGMQLLNVFLGGTLIPHIDALPGHIIHKGQNDVYHGISISQESHLFAIAGIPNETVNSSHHQALDIPGSGLVITAFSEDGIPEAAELSGENGQFCIAVQWHPERMDVENPLSGKIGRAFIRSL
jgi:putative glutamine amidotransferase